MPAIKSLEELRRLRQEALEKRQAKTVTGQIQITVGMGTCGIAAGAREALKTILKVIETENLSDIVVKQTGCMGLCEWEPIVEVVVGAEPKIAYGKVSVERAKRIMQEHIIGGSVIPEFVIPA
jgi:NADP-reducing hydrogenase subunit HndB